MNRPVVTIPAVVWPEPDDSSVTEPYIPIVWDDEPVTRLDLDLVGLIQEAPTRPYRSSEIIAIARSIKA